MEFFDTHSHYQDEAFDNDREIELKRAYSEGITKIVVPGWNIENSKTAIELSNKYDFIYSAIGIHPSDVGNEGEDITKLYDMANNEKVVAIGEIGLDYHYENISIELQKKYFIEQIKIANELKLPIIIHTRDAIADTLEIVKKYRAEFGGVFHCCPHNIELVKEVLKLGFYVGIGGTLTFKSAKEKAKELLDVLPIEKIVIETDSPYLSPEPYRGTRNDSVKVKEVAKKIAEIKEISLEEVARITYENGNKLFFK